jgi:hypothetical protein
VFQKAVVEYGLGMLAITVVRVSLASIAIIPNGSPAMKKFFLPAIALPVSLFALSLLATWEAHAQTPHHTPTKSTAPKVETYMVIKVTNENKDESKGEHKIEYKAIATSQLKDEKKKAEDDYKQKLKEAHDLRKTDPTTPMPKKIKIQVLKRDYETQKIAQEYADKLKDEEADKGNVGTKPKDVKK